MCSENNDFPRCWRLDKSTVEPCPQCDSTAIFMEADDCAKGMCYKIVCANCASQSFSFHSQDEAIEAWNKESLRFRVQPCPLCGGEARIDRDNFVYCTECYCRSDSWSTEILACENWNERESNRYTLKSCPLCDGSGVLTEVENPRRSKKVGWRVICSKCKFETAVKRSKNDAINTWNGDVVEVRRGE